MLASRGVPVAPAPDPGLKINWNPLSETWHTIQFTRGNRAVFLSMLGISWYWFLGALMLSQFPSYAKDHLGGNESVVTLLLAVFAIGVGLGSLLCERLSGHKIEIGLVPFGSIGLSLFILDLFFASPAAGDTAARKRLGVLSEPGSWRVLIDLMLIGVFGGFYIVPLYALVQSRSDPCTSFAHHRREQHSERVVHGRWRRFRRRHAGSGRHHSADVPGRALLNAAVALYIYPAGTRVSDALPGVDADPLASTVCASPACRISPRPGPRLLACNHVSFVDAVVISGALPAPDPLRHGSPDLPHSASELRVPHRQGDPHRARAGKTRRMLRSRLRRGRARARQQVIWSAIFPEGRITDTGELSPFRGGMQAASSIDHARCR